MSSQAVAKRTLLGKRSPRSSGSISAGPTSSRPSSTSLARPRAIARDIVPTFAEGGPEVVAGRMVEAAHGERATWAGVAASMGCLACSTVTGDDRAVPEPARAVAGLPLYRLAKATGLLVTLINDARAFTLAEGLDRRRAGCRTVVCVTLGTGSVAARRSTGASTPARMDVRARSPTRW